MPLQIIQLPTDEWTRYRDIRLAALLESPNAFCSTFNTEAVFSEEQWKSRMPRMWFAVGDDSPSLCGMIGLILQSNDTTSAHVVSFWVSPPCRCKGVGKALLRHVQTFHFTSGSPLKKICLDVIVTQTEAIGLYHRLDFRIVALEKNAVLRESGNLDQYRMEWHAHCLIFQTNN